MNWRRSAFAVSLVTLAVVLGQAQAAPFTPGNLVVSRVGDGSAALDSSATATFLDEYTPAGALVQSIALPTSVNGSHRRLTSTGDNGNEGFVTRSYNGQYLLMAGYDAPVGTPGVNATANTANGGTVDRVVALIDANGNINTTTALSADNSFNTSAVRSVASDNGLNLWVAGVSNGTRTGVRYTTLGASTSTRAYGSTSQFNFRVVNIFADANNNPQLYASRGNSNTINTIGSGLPTTSDAANNPVSLFSYAGSGYDFLILDANTLYIADDNAYGGGFGGIQKYVFDGSSWVFQYALQTDLPVGPVRGLTGAKDAAGNPVLYTTTGDGDALYSVTDMGAASPFSLLATAGQNMTFRGVDFAPIPEPAAVSLLAVGAVMLLRRRR